jgi:hypothetical protein
MLTGVQSGPEFDKLVPLMEEGAKLQAPRLILGVKQRVAIWMEAQKSRH